MLYATLPAGLGSGLFFVGYSLAMIPSQYVLMQVGWGWAGRRQSVRLNGSSWWGVDLAWTAAAAADQTSALPQRLILAAALPHHLILAAAQRPLRCAHAAVVLAPLTHSSCGLACVQVGAPRWLACIVTTWGLTAMAFAFSECWTVPIA